MFPANHAPSANDDAFVIPQGSNATTLQVLENDVDVDGDAGDSLQVIKVTQPLDDSGVVILAEDGTVAFLPASGFFGQSYFQYTVADTHGSTSTATVTLTITNAMTGKAYVRPSLRFIGFSREKYNIYGTPDKIFNLLTQSNVQVRLDPFILVERSIVYF